MRDVITWYYYALQKERRGLCRRFHIPFSKTRYAGQKLLSDIETADTIAEAVRTDTPFLACRMGSSEMNVVYRTLQKRITGNDFKYVDAMDTVCATAGVFPNKIDNIERLCDIFVESIKESDLMGIWRFPFEDYAVRQISGKTKVTPLANLEPWNCRKYWSGALVGKKVLVVHPFDETIRRQYEVREKLFPGTNILPKFELQTYKAVQTLNGVRDPRDPEFSDWFEALDYMTQEISKLDFDVAIVGCGAYGLPLAANIKKMGKVAIHLGGAIQLMFGIKGSRWDNNPRFTKWYNDYWTRPGENEKPKGYEKIEGGCYW